MEQNSVGSENSLNPRIFEANNKHPNRSTGHQNETTTSHHQLDKPSSKLEHIEKFLLNSTSCEVSASATPATNISSKFRSKAAVANLHNSSGIINTITPNAVLNTQMCCQKLLTNLTLFDEPKIFSLQRSISDKLRNSFKSNSHNVNGTQASKDYVQLRAPRKWHSERCRVSSKNLSTNPITKPPSSRFSTQVPLSNHHKTILAQYTKPKSEQIPQTADEPYKTTNNNYKLNNKVLQLNKKLVQLTISKKPISQTETTINVKETKFFANATTNNDSGSSIISLDTENDENNNHLMSKSTNTKQNKKHLKKHLEMSFIDLIKMDASVDTDTDSIDSDVDDHTEAKNFDYNSRRDFILSGYLEPNQIEALRSEIRSLTTKPSDLFEDVLSVKDDCVICCEEEFIHKRPCCGFLACNRCVNTYIRTQVRQCYGSIRIECINVLCNKLIHRDEISERLSGFDKEALATYLKILVDANKDSNCKTCPRCSHLMNIAKGTEKSKKSSSKSKLHLNTHSRLTKVQCTECQLVWCFHCHAPWHDGITCGEFRKGDRMLKYWANEVHYGQQNAQLCPKCKIYIQRTKGCDHMVCTFCQTNFCYKCGGKFRRLKFLGDHYSRLSILGCKYRFYPDKPAKRRAVRGSILCGKVIATPVVATLTVVVGVGALAVGIVALPAYGSYKLVKLIHNNHKKGKFLNSAYNSDVVIEAPTQVVPVDVPKTSKTDSQCADASGGDTTAPELNLIPREATTEPQINKII